MAFEQGNTLAAKRRQFEQAVRRSLAADDYASLRKIVDKVRDLAETGERWAVELIRDTLDGKPAQQIIATDNEGRSLAIGLVAYAAELRPEEQGRTIEALPSLPDQQTH
jgi:CHASE3 domain sensor protein